MEVYYNSRQFMRALKLFEQEFDGAFAMYEYMAGYYGEQHLTGLNHSRLARYEIFHDLISRKVEQERMSMFEDALMCDLYLRENAKSRRRLLIKKKSAIWFRNCGLWEPRYTQKSCGPVRFCCLITGRKTG